MGAARRFEAGARSFSQQIRGGERIDNSLHGVHSTLRQLAFAGGRFTLNYLSPQRSGESMFTARKLVPAICVAASLSGLAVYAATTTPATTTATAPAGGHWHHHHHHGFMGFVLHKLGLSDTQKTQVQSIVAGQKSQFEALRASVKANRQALATTPPTDSGYPALIQTAQTNAATRIRLESETWSAVYENVLSQTQRDAIPGIVAAAQAQRAERMAAWKAAHAQAAAAGATEN
jgi:Spy/CpxP family protein refolding chaperone